jgi:hypothetical protein
MNDFDLEQDFADLIDLDHDFASDLEGTLSALATDEDVEAAFLSVVNEELGSDLELF